MTKRVLWHGLLAGGLCGLLAIAATVACRPAAPAHGPVIEPVPTSPPIEVTEPIPEPEAPAAPQAPAVAGPSEAGTGREVTLRVGLYTDRSEARFDCCGPLRAVAGDAVVIESRDLRITPMAESVARPVFRLQVAALEAAGRAEDVASRLANATGWPGDVVHDAATGLHKVRVGAFASAAEAEAAKRTLRLQGVSEAWTVSEGGELRQPALRLQAEGRAWKVRGRWLAVESPSGEGVRVGEHRYGGRMLVYLNDRGLLNVIDELPLEDYVRQVVPREMGPDAYPELESLKAQAVAARTYTVRNLGEFLDEGYDICATPRCQVFGGLQDQHPRSDRAVDETAGEILLWHDEPIDALYSSTCGGHTEDVEVVFPLKEARPYLRGVPCIEAGGSTLAGAPPGAPEFPIALTRGLLPPGDGTPRGWSDRVRSLARAVGLPAVGEALGSFDGPSIHQFLARTFDLALDRRLFLGSTELERLVESPPADWNAPTRRLAGSLLRLLTAPRGVPRPESERERLVLDLAAYLGYVRLENVRYLELSERELSVRGASGPYQVRMPPDVETVRQVGDRAAAVPRLTLLPGDDLDLVWRDGSVLAVVQELRRDAQPPIRPGAWRSWRRVKSARELEASVERQVPGFRLQDMEILERGRSGRVGRLRLVGRDGRREVLEGLAIRWALDLPDTLFQARHEADGSWEFTGRGWGHGVGLCQIGSFAMAQRGHTYRDILSYYYPGSTLGRVRIRGGTAGERAS